MYDASLDQFKPHSWSSLQSILPTTLDNLNWVRHGFSAVNSTEYNRITFPGVQQKPKQFDELLNIGWNEGYYGTYRHDYNLMRVESLAVANAPADAMEQVAVTNFAKTKAGKKGEEKQLADTVILQAKAVPQNNNVQVRKNFNETAFFFPALTTDADGNIEFSFTIPEALTNWKLMTLAHTKDLASGYLENTMVTQKPLMVQPSYHAF